MSSFRQLQTLWMIVGDGMVHPKTLHTAGRMLLTHRAISEVWTALACKAKRTKPSMARKGHRQQAPLHM